MFTDVVWETFSLERRSYFTTITSCFLSGFILFLHNIPSGRDEFPYPCKAFTFISSMLLTVGLGLRQDGQPASPAFPMKMH